MNGGKGSQTMLADVDTSIARKQEWEIDRGGREEDGQGKTGMKKGNKRVSQMRVLLTACRKLGVDYNTLLDVVYGFEHKM